jgi:hypothetical protein
LAAVYFDRLDDTQLAETEQSLKSPLARDDLHGLTFLEIGSSSGIFSLSRTRSITTAAPWNVP